MYAVLTGSCVGKSKVVSTISGALINIATNKTYECATNRKEPTVDPQYKGTTTHWKANHFVPDGKDCDFNLVVLAPEELGISPVWPFFLEASGPLFSVIIWEEIYIVMEESKDPVEFREANEVEKAFVKFLHRKKKVNEYMNCSFCGASVNKKNIQKHESQKCHNRTLQ